MKTITTTIKVLTVIAGGSAYFGWLPEKFLPVAALLFAGASTIKDLLVKVGDYADDKELNGSFKG